VQFLLHFAGKLRDQRATFSFSTASQIFITFLAGHRFSTAS
jgi:hypothetical protein